MIRTYLHLDIAPGQSENLVRVIKDLRILETSIEEASCLSAELTLSQDGGQGVITATWETADQYALWTSRSDRASHAETVSQFLVVPLGPDSTGTNFTIAHSAARHRRQPMRGEP